MANESLVIDVELELKNLNQEVNTLKSKFKSGGKKAGQEFSSGLKGSLSSLAGNLGALAVSKALGAITSSIGNTVAAASKLEVFETQFKVLLGSAGAAQRQMEELADFAANTPFQLDGLANATSQLLAFGFEQDQIKGKLSEIGDVAAGSGSDIKELSTIYGQVAAAGKLTGERLLQLQERAIPIGSVLAKSLGVAEESVRDLVSNGKVGFKEFEKAFADLSSSGGIFEKGAENLSKTLSGRLSTLSDNLFNFNAEIGKAFAPILKEIVGDAIGIVQQLVDVVKNNAKSIIDNFFIIARAINDYLVAPFELVLNATKVVGNAINTFAAGVIAAYGQIGLGIATALNKVGIVSDETLDSVKNFAESSSEVLQENFDDLNKSAEGLFDGTIYASNDEYINGLQGRVNKQIELNEQLKNSNESTRTPTPEIPEEALASTLETSDIFKSIFDGFDEELAGANKTAAGFQNTLKNLGKNSKKILVNGLGNAAGQGFAAFGKALATGENGLKAFGDALLSSFGSMLVQQGTGFILQGIAQSIAGAGSGAPLIAAGASMATFGGVLSGIGGGSTSTSPSSGGDTGSSPFDESAQSALTGDEQTAQAGNIVNLTVEGNILDRRESASELVSIINEGIDSDNLTINQSFA
tara:strand:+ start:2823 stop:4745 length:1923 start_codon:yes stop_codon:yes gene_type:complete